MATVQHSKKDLPQLKSIDRISKIPVVETGVQYATIAYWKIKNSNALMRWSLKSFEGGIQKAVEISFAAVPLLEMPLILVDNIVCKSLDTVEQRVPAINYPPELLLNMTKDLVSTRIVQPAIQRVDSVKQFSVTEATKYTEIAASRLDTALNVADLYVDKYLPDATEPVEPKKENHRSDTKTSQTIEHVNRFSKKLKRRLTKRTIAEAKALKKQGVDTAQLLMYLVDLLIKDPKQFMEKMKAVWNHLSQDEPENQKPPANLEQLIAMLTRETARRFVHLTNGTVHVISQLPTYTSQAVHISQEYLSIAFDHVSKTINLDAAKAMAVARARYELETVHGRIRQFYSLIQYLIETLGSRLQNQNQAVIEVIPLKQLSKETKDQVHEHPDTSKQENSTNNVKETSSPKRDHKSKHNKSKTSSNKDKSDGDENSNRKNENSLSQ